MDVSEDEKQYVITAELPGVKKDDVSVELHEGVLTIHGEKAPKPRTVAIK